MNPILLAILGLVGAAGLASFLRYRFAGPRRASTGHSGSHFHGTDFDAMPHLDFGGSDSSSHYHDHGGHGDSGSDGGGGDAGGGDGGGGGGGD